MKKERYKITLYGCDDSTEFTFYLNKLEASLINKISKKSEEVSSYVCMPTIGIDKIKIKK